MLPDAPDVSPEAFPDSPWPIGTTQVPYKMRTQKKILSSLKGNGKRLLNIGLAKHKSFFENNL